MDNHLAPTAAIGETVNTTTANLSAEERIQQAQFEQFWQELLQEEQTSASAQNQTPATPDHTIQKQTATDHQSPSTAQIVFDQQIERVRQTVSGNPRFTEIHFRILEYCQEQQQLRDIEVMITTLPQFSICDQTQYRLISFLENAGGLKRIELDERLNTITPQMKEGLSEDEIDDLICDYAFLTTEAGREVVQEMQPEKRIKNLMELFPQRAQTYCEVLEYCKEPRSWQDIDKLLEGRDVLKSGSLNPYTNNPLKPSVFIDRLESSGGLVWDKAQGWQITAEGRRFLEIIQNTQV
jgi:hypothetical protein